MKEYIEKCENLDKSTLIKYAGLARGDAFELTVRIGTYFKRGKIFKSMSSHDSDGYPFGGWAKNYIPSGFGSLNQGTLNSAFENYSIVSLWNKYCKFDYKYVEKNVKRDRDIVYEGFFIVCVEEAQSAFLYEKYIVNISNIQNEFYERNKKDFDIYSLLELRVQLLECSSNKSGHVIINQGSVIICNKYINTIDFKSLGLSDLPNSNAVLGFMKFIYDFHLPKQICGEYDSYAYNRMSHLPIFGVIDGEGYIWYTSYETNMIKRDWC